MRTLPQPLTILLVTFVGWMRRYEQHVIAYLLEENRVLKEQLGGRRLRLTDDQRRRLAAAGKRIGRKALDRVATIVTVVHHYSSDANWLYFAGVHQWLSGRDSNLLISAPDRRLSGWAGDGDLPPVSGRTSLRVLP